MRFVPLHQFEIRYSNILGFPSVIHDVIAPFVKLANNINVERENSHEERITLHFEDASYVIIVAWDRLILKSEGNIESFGENNSMIEDPFFNLFNKIQQLSSFGEVKNVLYVSFWVNVLKDRKFDDIKNDFVEKHLSNSCSKLIGRTDDVAVTLEKQESNSQTFMSFGPYGGKEDLIKRNIINKNPDVTLFYESIGEMLEFKHFENSKQVSFRTYKEIIKKENEALAKLWE